jgi:hypothetical protein
VFGLPLYTPHQARSKQVHEHLSSIPHLCLRQMGFKRWGREFRATGHTDLVRPNLNPSLLPEQWNGSSDLYVACYLLVPGRSLLSLDMIAALDCFAPTYTVLISMLPNIILVSHCPVSTQARIYCRNNIRILQLHAPSLSREGALINFFFTRSTVKYFHGNIQSGKRDELHTQLFPLKCYYGNAM